jgi:hypothetical protein
VFAENQLTSITIPNNVIEIGDYAFFGNQLTSITIPNSVIEIGDYAFSGNQLTSVSIPASVAIIGPGSFVGNVELTAIDVSADNTNFSSVDGVLYNKNSTALLQWPEGKGGVSIPSSVAFIGKVAFLGNQLTTIVIPDNVTFIGDGAFKSNNLTSVSFPDSVKVIGSEAFANNDITTITIGADVELSGSSLERNFDRKYNTSTRSWDYYGYGFGKAAGTYTKRGNDWLKQPQQ